MGHWLFLKLTCDMGPPPIKGPLYLQGEGHREGSHGETGERSRPGDCVRGHLLSVTWGGVKSCQGKGDILPSMIQLPRVAFVASFNFIYIYIYIYMYICIYVYIYIYIYIYTYIHINKYIYVYVYLYIYIYMYMYIYIIYICVVILISTLRATSCQPTEVRPESGRRRRVHF